MKLILSMTFMLSFYRMEIPDLTKRWKRGDVTLVVEGGPIFVNREVMSVHSDMMDVLLNTDVFCEVGQHVFNIPKKTFESVLATCQVIHQLQLEITRMYKYLFS